MTGVPSNGNHRIVKALEQRCEEWARDPSRRRALNFFDYGQELEALGHCISDGVGDASDLADFDEDVVVASAEHYKRLARKIVEFSLRHPDDAPGVLADFIRLMELVPYARTHAFKERAGLH